MGAEEERQPPFSASLATMLTWSLIFMVGHIRDFFRRLLFRKQESERLGYAPVRQEYEDFYTRRAYYRIQDSFNRPIASAPSNWVEVLERVPLSGKRGMQRTGRSRSCLNLGSYNYLGFAAADEHCTPLVLRSLEDYGWATCSARADAGTTPVHVQLEQRVAAFVGKEAAIVLGMGFATNSLVIPALVGRGCLILSDALNHASIVAGARASGAKVKVFGHNNMAQLEALLRTSIAEGQPRTHRPWRKVLIIVEGIYSMEGDTCCLAEVVALKQRYKAFLFLDEAHSIGALGASGRGCAEHCGVDPADIDVMMGTFTKSFGASGGYIAASREVVAGLRAHAPGQLLATSMSVPVTVQILAALEVITGADGSGRGAEKLAGLKAKANWMRERLEATGCIVMGVRDSPVLPLMVYQPGKLSAFSRLCLERGVAVVSVGFPATSLTGTRIRLCISAAHTWEDLELALRVLDEVADMCLMKYRAPSLLPPPAEAVNGCDPAKLVAA